MDIKATTTATTRTVSTIKEQNPLKRDKKNFSIIYKIIITKQK